jgi:F-type H+-transporting ATPase subunit delta
LSKEQIISGVAQRYARSLFELAQEEKLADSVAEELAALSTALEESTEFRSFARSPILTAQEQIDVLKNILPKLGVKNLTANFVQLLAQNRRLSLLEDAISAYKMLLDRSKDIAKAEVISAEPLSTLQVQTLKDALKGTASKDIRLEQHVDQSLIGGLIVRLGSRMIDTSLKTKLSTLKTALKGIA